MTPCVVGERTGANIAPFRLSSRARSACVEPVNCVRAMVADRAIDLVRSKASDPQPGANRSRLA